MPIRQKIFALIAAIALCIFIVEMVRRKKLREEYSWLWLITSLGIIILVIWYDLLVFITRMIGAALPTTTLFVFGLLFLLMLLINLYRVYSLVRLYTRSYYRLFARKNHAFFQFMECTPYSGTFRLFLRQRSKSMIRLLRPSSYSFFPFC